MTTERVDVRLAGAQLSRLLQRVEAGEEFVISRSGKPVARLVPYIPPNRPRVFGALNGQIRTRPGFDELDDEIHGRICVKHRAVDRPMKPWTLGRYDVPVIVA